MCPLLPVSEARREGAGPCETIRPNQEHTMYIGIGTVILIVVILLLLL